ncbi:MAG: alkaline phosphatase family protein [Halieaceae bacterium]|nr:alkaline phosphatase family protein [Halieaceae bacterium]
MLRRFTLLAWVILLGSAQVAAQPRLVVQITVDQLRGDLPWRHMDQFGEGGFRYLAENGVWYTNAAYQHANTETIVGHTSLATGAVPAVHGMVGNIWFDRGSSELVYNIEDPRYSLLSADAGVDKSSEIDPTQRVATTDGRSPRGILSSTFSDELANRYGGASKIFGVSVKDRGAVPLAGRSGKAFWFSKSSGNFVTSDFYYDAYPDWVAEWNGAGKLNEYAGSSWTLLNNPESYQRLSADNSPWETDFPGFNRTFPHSWGARDDKYFTTLLTVSPAGDELTLDFVKALVTAEDLGQDETPDFLSVSFSSTDYIGHLFGSSSLEMEDNLLRLDRILAELLSFIDKKVGLENTLIVLSADHGGPEVPGYLRSLGDHVEHVDPEYFDTTALNEALRQNLGVDVDLVKTFFTPYVYLDQQLIAAKGLDLAEIQREVAQLLIQRPEVFTAFAAVDMAGGRIPDSPIAKMAAANYLPQRSGDVHVVFGSQEFIADFDGLTVAATHGSPWHYDRHVPVVFVGSDVKPARVSRAVTPYDIASTMANILGIEAPSGSVGEVLVEVTPPVEMP